MPGIKNLKRFSDSSVSYGYKKGHKDIHGDDIDDDDNRQKWCPSCLAFGTRSPLRRRMYKVEGTKLVAAQVPDADKFRQCYLCGDIVPLYNVKYESKIGDFVETIDNPFDANPGKMDGFLPLASVRKGKTKSVYKRKKEQISKIKDEDVRKELAQGNIVNYYSED